MVDLLFLYNKDTTKVSVSSAALPPEKRDLKAVAQEPPSDDEDEVIGLKGYEPEEEEEGDLQFDIGQNTSVSIDSVYTQMDKFRFIMGDEEERESIDYADGTFLLNFKDKLGRTALHYS